MSRKPAIAARMGLAAFAAIGLVAPALPVEAGDTLRGGYGVGGPILAPLPEPADVSDPGFGYPLGQAPGRPAEPYDPMFDVGWSLGLRGSYVRSQEQEYFEALSVPEVRASYEGVRAAIDFSASAEIARPSNEQVQLRAFDVDLGTAYALDSVTDIEAGAALSLSQDSPNDPSLASNVAEPAAEVFGSGTAGITRQFGHLGIGLRGSLNREVYGDTILDDGTAIDNSANNRTAIGSGLRLSYALTPILTPFVDGQIGRDFYDAPSASGVWADGTTYEAKAGVQGKWGETLEAEASIGWGWRRFNDGSLAAVASTLYDARITYRPNRSLTFGGQFGTAFEPPGPDSNGTTRVDYTASADLGYRVNSWLGLRALASWNYAELAPTGDVERGHGFGLGADYLLNSHASVSADYGYDHSETNTDPATDTHRVMLGLTLSK